MNNIRYKIWYLITIVFSILITTIILNPLVLNPSHLIPLVNPDGGKNIFVYLFHILYENGFWTYCMNYPYGENIVFTDGQPILSVTVSYFKGITIPIALAILWRLIALSYILSIIYIYKLLVHFKVKYFLALIFAILITFMSPQVFRIPVHMGLSYCCIIPMLFYWTVMYNYSNYFKYLYYITALGIVSCFLHPYFFGVILVWIVFYILGYIIFTKGITKIKLLHIFSVILCAIVIFSVIGLVMKFTDPIKDRPVAPYGTLNYCTTLQQIYTSFYSPIWSYISTNTSFKDLAVVDEGFCYTGFTTLLISVLSFLIFIFKSNKKTLLNNFYSQTNFSLIWLFIGICALLLSMGIPFIWNMEWLLDYISFFRQFRSLGRFSWIFYFIITIYIAVLLNHIFIKYNNSNKKLLAYVILCFSLCLWAFEWVGYFNYHKDFYAKSSENYDIYFGNNENSWKGFLKSKNFKPDDFQAILLIKFFNAGTDKIVLGGEYFGTNIILGVESGIQLGLPIVDAFMSRSSWEIAEKQVKISAGPFVHKPIFDDIKSTKPFLLIQSLNSPDPDEQYLISHSDFIGDFQHCKIYACYPDKIKFSDNQAINNVKSTLGKFTSGDTCLVDKGFWYVNHFDEIAAKYTIFGNGSIPEIQKRDTVVLTIPSVNLVNDQLYEFSCWFLFSNQNCLYPRFNIEMFDINGNNLSNVFINAKESNDNFGLWFRTNSYFYISSKCKSIKVRLQSDLNQTYKLMDEVLLRHVDAIIVSKSENGTILVNNHLLK